MSYSQKAVDKWQKNNVRKFSFSLMVKSDADILARLDEVESKTDYIRRLIRADIAGEKAGKG